jgi:hypothetical protein
MKVLTVYNYHILYIILQMEDLWKCYYMCVVIIEGGVYETNIASFIMPPGYHIMAASIWAHTDLLPYRQSMRSEYY